jgi:hypothetical protein
MNAAYLLAGADDLFSLVIVTKTTQLFTVMAAAGRAPAP